MPPPPQQGAFGRIPQRSAGELHLFKLRNHFKLLRTSGSDDLATSNGARMLQSTSAHAFVLPEPLVRNSEDVAVVGQNRMCKCSYTNPFLSSPNVIPYPLRPMSSGHGGRRPPGRQTSRSLELGDRRWPVGCEPGRVHWWFTLVRPV